MYNLVLLIVCFLAGVLLRWSGRMPEGGASVLNSFIITISLPAITLLHIHELRLGGEMLFMVAMPWLHFGLAVVFFLLLSRMFGFSRSVTGVLILCAGLGNTSFVGLPMIEAFYGREALVHGIVVDQLGSFLVLSIAGISVAGIYSGGGPSVQDIARSIVTFPPFIAMVIALGLLPFEYPLWLTAVLQRLGDTLAPIALVSVGFQLHTGRGGLDRRALFSGLLFKLVLAPFMLMLLYRGMFGLEGVAVEVTLFEAAMPPMITAGIVAEQYGLEPGLANMLVAGGILLSFVTLPLWVMML